MRAVSYWLVFCFCVIVVVVGVPLYISTLASAQKPATDAKPPRSIPVPQKLADDYRVMVQSEQQALEAAMQTPQWKDYQILQQQRLKQEAIIASELGCPASKARIPRDQQGRILTNTDGRIERIECADTKE